MNVRNATTKNSSAARLYTSFQALPSCSRAGREAEVSAVPQQATPHTLPTASHACLEVNKGHPQAQHDVHRKALQQQGAVEGVTGMRRERGRGRGEMQVSKWPPVATPHPHTPSGGPPLCSPPAAAAHHPEHAHVAGAAAGAAEVAPEYAGNISSSLLRLGMYASRLLQAHLPLPKTLTCSGRCGA